jgi:hypothetical protein
VPSYPTDLTEEQWDTAGVGAAVPPDLLRARVRVAAGRQAEPSATVMDSQPVRGSAQDVVPTATSGYDS